MTPPDFETHETGTFAKLDVQTEKVRRLERERAALMYYLKYDEDELARAVEMYEATVFVPVHCARCGKETSSSVSVDRADNPPLVTCGDCRQ